MAIITLNRPARVNALTMLSHEELGKAIEVGDKHDHISMIVIMDAGTFFCFGDDVKDVL